MGMQKLCKTPAREARHFRDFPRLSFPSKQAQEHSKRSRNDWVTANFDEFHKISYISVIFGPKIMLLGLCDGHGYWSHVHPCSSMVTWSCWQQHNVGASSRWFCGDKLITLLVAWSHDHAPGSMVTWLCSCSVVTHSSLAADLSLPPELNFAVLRSQYQCN